MLISHLVTTPLYPILRLFSIPYTKKIPKKQKKGNINKDIPLKSFLYCDFDTKLIYR